jgi:acyl-CoA reductase-like NAD-dependent aldehyde dehydrogenase
LIGTLTNGASTVDVIDPATGRIFAVAPCADSEQLNAAVKAAKVAFPAWCALTTESRREKITALAASVETRLEEFSQLLTAEQGKPIAQARGEMRDRALAVALRIDTG